MKNMKKHKRRTHLCFVGKCQNKYEMLKRRKRKKEATLVDDANLCCGNKIALPTSTPSAYFCVRDSRTKKPPTKSEMAYSCQQFRTRLWSLCVCLTWSDRADPDDTAAVCKETGVSRKRLPTSLQRQKTKSRGSHWSDRFRRELWESALVTEQSGCTNKTC